VAFCNSLGVYFLLAAAEWQRALTSSQVYVGSGHRLHWVLVGWAATIGTFGWLEVRLGPGEHMRHVVVIHAQTRWFWIRRGNTSAKRVTFIGMLHVNSTHIRALLNRSSSKVWH